MAAKAYNIVTRILGLLLVLTLSSVVALQSPRVQTYLTHRAIDKLEGAIDGTMSVGKMEFMPLGAIHIDDIVIIDNNPEVDKALERSLPPADTLFSADHLSVTFSLKGILKKEGFHIRRATLEGVSFHFVKEPDRATRNNIKRIFRLPDPKEVPQETGNIFDIRKLRAKNIRFRMYNFKKEPGPREGGVHFEDMDIFATVIKGHALRFHAGRMHAVLDEAEFFEKHGVHCTEMTGRCYVGMGKTAIENFHLVDQWSDVSLKYYTMTYDNTYAFRDYVNKVYMATEFEPSVLSWKSVSTWTGAMNDTDVTLDIQSASAEGPVSDLTLHDLTVKELGSDIPVSVSGHITGLPDIRNVDTDFEIKDLNFTTRSLTSLLNGILPASSQVNLRNIAPGKSFSFNGSGSGPLDNLAVKGRLASSIGSVNANARIKNLTNEKPLSISANADINGLDAGLIANSELLGKVSGRSALTAVTGKNGMTLKLDSLSISSLSFKGYEYNGLKLDGTLDGSTVNGRISSDDPNVSLDLIGSGDIKPVNGISTYKLAGTISNIDLHKLNLDKREGVSRASSDIDADIMIDRNGMLDGNAMLYGLTLFNDSGEHRLGDIDISAESDGDQTIALSSNFAEGTFRSDKSAASLWEDIQNLTTRRHLSALYKEIPEAQDPGSYDISLLLHDTRELAAFAVPGLFLADSTDFRISVSDDGQLDGSLVSERIAYGTRFLKNASLKLDNRSDRLNAKLTGARLYAGAIDMQNPELNATASDNSVSARMRYEGFSNISDGGDIRIKGNFGRNPGDSLVVNAIPQDSYFKVGSSTWKIGESLITAVGRNINVDDFTISNGSQRIYVDGGLSSSRDDTLAVVLENLDLSLADEFTSRKYGIKGIAEGKAYLTTTEGNALGMLMNFTCDSLAVGGYEAGTIKLASNWNDEDQRLDLVARNTVEEMDALYAKGFYQPSTKSIGASAIFDSFPLAIAAPFVSGIFSETGGYVSGELTASGTTDNLMLSGDGINLNNAMLTVAYTGVPYVFNGDIAISDEKIIFDRIIISDNEDGSGILSGNISYRNVPEMLFNGSLDFNDMIFVNSADLGNNRVYGHLLASGAAIFNGPLSALQIDANVENGPDSEIHVPLGGSLSSTRSNLLTFKQPQTILDPYEEMLAGYNASKSVPVDIIAKGRVSVDEELKAFVEIDKEAGNVVSISGSGNVNLDVRSSKSKFDLNGDYSITQGNYRFALPGILNKDFTIQDGSTVKFNGDIMDTDLDINALYNVKTSLSTLIADSTVVASRRPVECGINITNKLRNPEIDFTIDIPDLDPTTKSYVESALNTEDKIQKQFVALLLMGSFIPSETSGVFNGTDMLYSNMADIFSNQLNSILQKLEIPFDLGFDYQGTKTGSNIFDVAISTQLFNNMVEINGSVGNKIYSTSKNPNGDVVGDLDISVKLDKPGKFRLNIFSHSADEHTSYLDYSQRNGLGLSYQKEYNHLGDFIKSLFMSKEERERKASEAQEKSKEAVIIKIENEQGETISDTDSAGR